MKWYATKAAHLAEHARLMKLEALDRFRESTILIRQATNRLLLYLEKNQPCWDSVTIKVNVSGSVSADNIQGTPGYTTVAEMSSGIGEVPNGSQ